MSNEQNGSYRSDYTTSVGLAEHGWTKAAIDRYLGEPDKLARNPHYRSGPPMRLYRVERVLAVQQSVAFDDWLRSKGERKVRAEASRQKRMLDFSLKYGSWTAALADGCEFLFDLNRYAKHPSCSGPHREAIYELKNDLVKLLYTHGYSAECFEHHRDLPDQLCFGCDGTGAFDLDDSEPCRRCNGTGVYRKGSTLTFVCFRFQIGGKTYCWHQPEKFVEFEYCTTKSAAPWEPGEEKKLVSLNKAKFAAAKDLLRWIVAESGQAESVAA